ncbi:hypothetical protein MN205_13930 [Kineococcus sp. TRM81007]|uniref:hypothetical protein n=1 Tax=Kineococcus sp. TRM81007 TaxID=2925831 RepID=UPI001F58F81C|nr:hypothetical protein [Kineococcus sp. TRM81007]MCI2239581.1 hypothetical protein [Kineococcus sp. TRM81007]
MFDRLRLMSHYEAPTPVWAPADVGAFVLSTTHLDHLGLDETLRTSLLRWQEYFDEHHPADLCGWDSPASHQRYAAEGQRLREELDRALPGIQVDLDLWPVPSDD